MINKVILLGRLGKDPVVRRTESGVPVATFSVATSESYKDKDGNWQDKTEWHNIVAWRALAEAAEQRLKKGYLVYFEGKITTRSYQQDNITKYITEVVIETMRIVDKGSDKGGHTNIPLPSEPANISNKQQPATTPQDTPDNFSENIDDLPF